MSENALVLCRKHLMTVGADQNETEEERQIAHFYLSILKNYSARDLVKFKHYGIGVGGSGENIIVMPTVLRTEQGVERDENDHFKIDRCTFNNFSSYLSFITRRAKIREHTELWMTLPTNVDGMLMTDYANIWFRQHGILRNRSEII